MKPAPTHQECAELKGATGHKCLRPARWFVPSGPCFVCWPHARRLIAQGERLWRT